MDQETCCLKWKDFPSNLTHTFQDLLTEGHFTDVTLVSDDEIQIQAHKIVLSASSPVLKNLLLDNPHSHPLLYIRGVKHQDLQSILQFMYFGEATIHQDCINEFMNIVQDFKINELIKDDNTEDNEFINDDDSTFFSEVKAESIFNGSLMKNSQSRSDTIDELLNLDIPEYNKSIVRNNMIQSKSFNCQHCESVFITRSGLLHHTRSKHEGMTYSCNQCKYKATQQSSLTMHQQSIHEGLTYSCNKCEFKATTRGHLTRHQRAKHEGIIYSCNMCDYKAKRKDNLLQHQQSKHEDVAYSCNKCIYKTTTKSSLRHHKQAKHEGMVYSCNQ